MWKYLNKDCNCNTTPTNPGVVCNHDGLKANELIYRGLDVACSGIYNGMTVAEVLQQIDYYLCSLEFTQQVLDIIQDNPQEFNDFIILVNGAINCETITSCGHPPSTTTTTSSSSSTTSTTTSTTTLFPPECIEVEINVGTNCPGQSYAILGYTDCNGVEQEVEVGAGDLPRFCVLDIPFPAFTCGDGSIDIIGKCNPITTTTTTIPLTTTTTTISEGCAQFTIQANPLETHVVEYIPCGSTLTELIFVEPEEPEVRICCQIPLISDNYPEYTMQGSECFAPITTTTTTTIKTYDNYQIEDCITSTVYTLDKTYPFILGDVVQYQVGVPGTGEQRCGTIISTTTNLPATASLFSNIPRECLDFLHCPKP